MLTGTACGSLSPLPVAAVTNVTTHGSLLQEHRGSLPPTVPEGQESRLRLQQGHTPSGGPPGEAVPGLAASGAVGDSWRSPPVTAEGLGLCVRVLVAVPLFVSVPRFPSSSRDTGHQI